MLDYAIVVPSRKRPHNMPLLRSILPTAIICVDEREIADYAHLVPEHLLLSHPPMDGAPRVINWIIDAIEDPILVLIDDDFRGVKCIVGTHRYITDPEEILAIIENAAIVCRDLGLTTFAWSRTQNTAMNKADMTPMLPQGPICNARGVMGAARHRKYDMSMHGRADVDWSLRTLLEDRCVLVDMRFFFDCGPIYAGRGGSVDLITGEQFEKASRLLKEKWGMHISFKRPNFQKSRSVQSMKVNVKRRSPMGQK